MTFQFFILLLLMASVWMFKQIQNVSQKKKHQHIPRQSAQTFMQTMQPNTELFIFYVLLFPGNSKKIILN